MREYIIWESDGIEVQGHHVTQHEQREEIVRCRDCRYYNRYQDLCERLQPGMLVLEPDDGFCAWGERRER